MIIQYHKLIMLIQYKMIMCVYTHFMIIRRIIHFLLFYLSIVTLRGLNEKIVDRDFK